MAPGRHTCQNRVPLPGMGEVFSHVWRTTALAPVGFGEASIVEPRWFLVQTQEPWLTARMANLKETAQAEDICEEDTYRRVIFCQETFICIPVLFILMRYLLLHRKNH